MISGSILQILGDLLIEKLKREFKTETDIDIIKLLKEMALGKLRIEYITSLEAARYLHEINQYIETND